MALLQMDWNPASRALRRFGASFALSAAVFAAALWWFGSPPLLAASVGGSLALAGILMALLPRQAARPIYLAIMVPTFLLGSVVSRVLVGLLFYFVVTPIGLALRFRKHDPLALKPTPGSDFVDSPAQDESPDSFERTF